MSKAAGGGGSSTETVKVMVRVRPMNTKEKTKGKSRLQGPSEHQTFQAESSKTLLLGGYEGKTRNAGSGNTCLVEDLSSQDYLLTMVIL